MSIVAKRSPISATAEHLLVYVRPTVEYNSIVWLPHAAKDINTVEWVQRRFTKRLPGLISTVIGSYQDRLRLATAVTYLA